VPTLLPRIMMRAVDLLKADRGGGIYLYDHERNILRLESAVGSNHVDQRMTLQIDEGVSGQVLQTCAPLIINDYTHWNGRASPLVSDTPSAVMGIPLLILGRVEGVLLVFANSAERTFTPDDQNLAEMFAAQAAAALHNAQLYSAAQREIVSRRQTEAALRESEERFRQIAENFDQILFVRSQDDRNLLYVNPHYETVQGRSRESLYENPDSYMEHMHPDDVESVWQQLRTQRYLEEGFADYEYRLIIPGQATRWFRARRFPIKSEEGSILRRAGIAEDITERKLAEEALRQALVTEKELGELKSRFVSMASHEFRTPLATILAFTESLSLFRHKLTNEQIDKKLNNIRGQVEHLKDIMDDVLLLARMQARRVEFNPEKVNLDALCQSILHEFESHPDVQHTLDYVCDPGIDEAILDRRLVRQIISNLLSNAIKYSSEDQPVHIGLSMTDTHYILRIRDYGIGIPEADLKHLFEPFHRASNVGTISGTGLGLVIVKDSVELHGGTISVESVPGEGSTFTVLLLKTTGDVENVKNSSH
jgi:PAS domain S-box-containing protein